MKRRFCAERGVAGRWPAAGRSEIGAQLVEFAIAVPILLLLVVGVWDFGSALLLKQKLTNAAREGARVMVSTPIIGKVGASCTGSTTPCSVQAAATAVQQYLTQAGLDASWITPATASTPAACEWIYGSQTNSNYELEIISNKKAVNISGNGAPLSGIPATAVTLSWPVHWSLKALLPSGIFPAKISTTFTMANIGGGC